jgi:hypothetical protein
MRDRGAVGLAALAGVSVWVSLGALAVTGANGARVAALPAWWMLFAFAGGGGAIAWLIRLRTSESWPLALTTLLWLPYLPAPVPAAGMVWDGPVEMLVWMAAIGGASVARMSSAWRPSWTRALGDSRVAPWLVEALGFAMAIGSALALADRLPGGDEPHYLIITQSLLSDGDLRIQNNHDRGDYFAYVDDPIEPDFLQRGADEQIYSVHAPGLPVLLSPAFAIAGYPGAVALIALLSAMGLSAAWRASAAMTDAASAWAATLAVGLSAPVVCHSFAIFPDPVGATIVALVLCVVVRLDASPTHVTLAHLAGAGLLLGLLPWLHTRFAVIAGMFGLVVAGRISSRADRWQALGSFAIGPALLALAWFGFFWTIYGTPNPAAPYGNSHQNAIEWIGRGLVGLAVDQQFGLVASAPVLLLAIVGWWWLLDTNRRLAGELLLIVVPYTLTVASFGMWWAGWSAPARFLVALLPIAAPLLAVAWARGGRLVRSTFVCLALFGIANVLPRLGIREGLLLYNQRDGYDLWLDWASRHVNLPLAFPSVHRDGAIGALALAVAWLACGAITLSLLAGALRRVRGRGATSAITAAVGALTVMLGTTVSWALSRASVLTPASSHAAFLDRWDAATHSLVLAVPGWRRMSSEQVLGALELDTSERARERVADDAVLSLAWVPAGTYRVQIEGAATLAGVLGVTVGTTAQPVETWSLDGVRAGATSLELSLPAPAQSLIIRADQAARRRITRLSLRPVPPRPITVIDRGHVVRASKYGRSHVYLLDDGAYMEAGGLWTRPNATSRVLVTTDRLEGSMDVQAGPVPSIVVLEAGQWATRAELKAGERRRLLVPTGAVISIHTTGMFRPIDFDTQTRDRRALGVRLEFPER